MNDYQKEVIEKAIRVISKYESDVEMDARAYSNFACMYHGMAIMYGVAFSDLEGMKVLQNKGYEYEKKSAQANSQ